MATEQAPPPLSYPGGQIRDRQRMIQEQRMDAHHQGLGTPSPQADEDTAVLVQSQVHRTLERLQCRREMDIRQVLGWGQLGRYHDVAPGLVMTRPANPCRLDVVSRAVVMSAASGANVQVNARSQARQPWPTGCRIP